jgi:hypothetical protein
MLKTRAHWYLSPAQTLSKTRTKGGGMSKGNIRIHFESNMLDGQDLYDCGKAMLSAEYVYRYIKENYILKGKEKWTLKSLKRS